MGIYYKNHHYVCVLTTFCDLINSIALLVRSKKLVDFVQIVLFEKRLFKSILRFLKFWVIFKCFLQKKTRYFLQFDLYYFLSWALSNLKSFHYYWKFSFYLYKKSYIKINLGMCFLYSLSDKFSKK